MEKDKTCSTDGSCGTCSSAAACDSQTREHHMDELLADKLHMIKHRIAVMSGKGGVGKTTVAVNLAVALASEGKAVGLLDGDIHGPNVPKMLGINASAPLMGESGLIPIEAPEGVKVMSLAFMLPNEDTPVVWRGPVKHSLFKQFLAEVDWGKLDYLIVDLPPGTGDEPLSVAQLLGKPLWSLIVTTPQDVALLDSRKSVIFSHTLEINVLGIVENMRGLICPHCGEQIDLFKSGGGERSSRDLNVPFLGAIPIDPNVVISGDSGSPIVAADPVSQVAEAFRALAHKVAQTVANGSAAEA
jgi:ATP-binding protein involved in chromosome partitioning